MSFNINNNSAHLWIDIVYGPMVDLSLLPLASPGAVIDEAHFGGASNALSFDPGQSGLWGITGHAIMDDLEAAGADPQLRVYLSGELRAQNSPHMWPDGVTQIPATVISHNASTGDYDMSASTLPIQKIVKFRFDNAIMDSYPSEIRISHRDSNGANPYHGVVNPPQSQGSPIELYMPLSADFYDAAVSGSEDQWILIGDSYGDGMLSLVDSNLPITVEVSVDGALYGPGHMIDPAGVPLAGEYELHLDLITELLNDAKVDEGKGLAIPITWDNSSLTITTTDTNNEIDWLNAITVPATWAQIALARNAYTAVPWIDLSDEVDLGLGRWQYKVSITSDMDSAWDLNKINEALNDPSFSGTMSLVNPYVHNYLGALHPGIVANVLASSYDTNTGELLVEFDSQIAPDPGTLGFVFDQIDWLVPSSLGFLTNAVTLETLSDNLGINFNADGEPSRISLDPSSNSLFTGMTSQQLQQTLANWTYYWTAYERHVISFHENPEVTDYWSADNYYGMYLTNSSDSSKSYRIIRQGYPDFSDPTSVQAYDVFDSSTQAAIDDVQTTFETEWPSADALGWDFTAPPPPAPWVNPYDLNASDPSTGINITEIEDWVEYNHSYSSSAPTAQLTLTINGDAYVDEDPTFLIHGGSKILDSGVTGTESLEVQDLGDDAQQVWNIDVPLEVGETYSIAFIDMWGDGIADSSPSIQLEDEYGNIIHQAVEGSSWETWSSSYLLNIQWTGSEWQVVAVESDTFAAANCSNCGAGGMPDPSGLIFDFPFGGAIKPDGITYVFPSGAEAWAGFATSDDPGYPISLADGGKIEFTAYVTSPAQVYFRFEKNPHPDTEPSYDTAVIDIIPSGDFDSYSVDLDPQDPNNTYSSMLFYVVTQDEAVYVNDIELLLNGNIDNAGAGGVVRLRLVSA